MMTFARSTSLLLLASALVAGPAAAQVTLVSAGQTCGDGIVTPGLGEACDDQNNVAGDGCSPTCQVEPHWSCAQPNLVVNGGFEAGNTAFTSELLPDPTGSSKPVCGGTRIGPRAQMYRVSSAPVLVCGCHGGSGQCLETFAGSDKRLWAETIPLVAGKRYKATFAYLIDTKVSTSQAGLWLKAAGVNLWSATGTPATTNSLAGSPASALRATGSAPFTVAANGSIPLEFVVSGAGAYIVIDSISLTGPSACSSPPVCGNGRIDAGEKCDDFNTTAGDGCNASCQVEKGWACAGAPTRCVQSQTPGSATQTQ